MMTKLILSLLTALIVTSTNGFVTNHKITNFPSCHLTSNNAITPTTSAVTTTSLEMGRQWNFNKGRSPWGLKKNAEIWNGRIAQLSFTVVLLQEAITGKGVIQAWQAGDLVSYIMFALTIFSIGGLTVWLAFQGEESDIPKFDIKDLPQVEGEEI